MLAGQKQVGLVGAAAHLIGILFRGLCLGIHIAGGEHALHFVLRGQEERGLFRLHGSALALHVGMVEHDLMGIASEYAMGSDELRAIRPVQCHMNLGRQRKRASLCYVTHAYGPARGLRCAEIDARLGGSVSAFLVEDQIAGFEVDGILEFLWSRLVGRGYPAGVGLQVDLHFSSGRDVARLRIVGEVVAINLVEAGGIAAVEDDVDVVQLGMAVELELLDALGANGEGGAAGFGF